MQLDVELSRGIKHRQTRDVEPNMILACIKLRSFHVGWERQLPQNNALGLTDLDKLMGE